MARDRDKLAAAVAVAASGLVACGCAHAPPPLAAPPPAKAPVVCVCFRPPGGRECLPGGRQTALPGGSFSSDLFDRLTEHGILARPEPASSCGGGTGPVVALFGNLRSADGSDEIDAHLALVPGPTSAEPVGSLDLRVRGRLVAAALQTRAVDVGRYSLTSEAAHGQSAAHELADFAAGVVAYLDSEHGHPEKADLALGLLRGWEVNAGAQGDPGAVAFGRQLRALLLFHSSCDETEDPIVLLRSARNLVPGSIGARQLVAVAALSRAYGAAPVCAKALERDLLASTLISPWDDATTKNLGSLYDLMSELPPMAFVPGQEIDVPTAVARRQMVPAEYRPEQPNGFELATGVGFQHTPGSRAALPALRFEASFGRRLSGFGATLGFVYAPADQTFPKGGGSVDWSRQALTAGLRRRWELSSAKVLPPFFEARVDGLLGMAYVEGRDYNTSDAPTQAIDAGLAVALRFGVRRWGVGLWVEPTAALWLRRQTVTITVDGLRQPDQPALPIYALGVLGGASVSLGD